MGAAPAGRVVVFEHDPDLLTVPALDCHTGTTPDLDAAVPTDLRHKLRSFLPGTVVGKRFDEPLANGDFAIAHDDLLAADLDRITRLQPLAGQGFDRASVGERRAARVTG